MESTPFRKPSLFVLVAEHGEDDTLVAHGVSFPEPNHRVVINWVTSDSVEVLDSVDDLYAKFGDEPVIRWYNDEQLSEAEPTSLTSSY